MEEALLDQNLLNQTVNPLLAWYNGFSRTLPWRKNKDSYRIWVSEIMLQQTRVETVRPYFDRFINELPTLQALADVPDERLLKLWEGLGYYRRAQNLRKGAQVVVREYGGHIPGNYEEIKKLPGIGSYTAGAIASIAFGLPVPAVDGNVIRVIARITGSRLNFFESKNKVLLEKHVQNMIPKDNAGNFNQALMELGALVCLPKKLPRCLECPLQSMCRGYGQKIAEELPIKPVKRSRIIEEKTVFLLTCKGLIGIKKRSSRGLLADMWEFPNIQGSLTREKAEQQVQEWGMTITGIHNVGQAKHIFTHVEWKLNVYSVDILNPEGQCCLWITRQQLETEYALPGAFRICLDKVGDFHEATEFIGR